MYKTVNLSQTGDVVAAILLQIITVFDEEIEIVKANSPLLPICNE